MKLTNNHLLSWVSAIIILACPSNGQDTKAIEWWRNALVKSSLPEISAMMREKANPFWPEVKSVRQSLDLEGAGKIALVKALHVKMRDSYRSGIVTPQEVEACCEISKRLQTAGGYSNRLLADCFDRLVVFRVTGWMVNKQRPLNEIRAVFNNWNVSSANDPNVWLDRFQGDDPEVKAVKEKYPKIESGTQFYPSTLGMLSMVSNMEPSDVEFQKFQTFTRLMEKPSVVILMYRITATESSKVVRVGGFLRFLEMGGKLDELDQKDVGPFETRMGGEREKFKYPPLSLRRLRQSDIKHCFDLHSNAEFGASFMDPALK